jgi:hypothetical protein
MVSKVGASGGGKAYKKSRPMNYYGILVVIVILGMASIVLSRYDYQHPSVASAGPAPTVGTTWYSVVSFDICGVNQALLPADTTAHEGFLVGKNDVIRISPLSAADAGNNATVSQFALEYPGFLASSTELAIPVKGGVATAATTYRNGLLCPKSSKYAGQSSRIEYAYWRTFSQKNPTITTNPASIKFSNEMELTIAVLPKSAPVLQPSAASIIAMVSANAQNGVTTTTTASGTTTSTSTTTTTVQGTTTTTTKG